MEKTSKALAICPTAAPRIFLLIVKEILERREEGKWRN
jgi:hypothetical protein